LYVPICASGPLRIELCQQISEYGESCSPPDLPPTEIASTNFKISPTVSGCAAGATYIYTWQRRPYKATGEPWIDIQQGLPKITIQNTDSYDLRCKVTSSCGRVGYSDVKSVLLYHITGDCTNLPEEN
jgi:hypothetical protein